MENTEMKNEIYNSEVEQLLRNKIQQIYIQNQNRFKKEGIDLTDISMSKVDGQVIYEVIEKDMEGNLNNSYYSGDSRLILMESSKFNMPVFSSKGIGEKLAEDPEKARERVEEFLGKFSKNKMLSLDEIDNNKLLKNRIDAIARDMDVDSNELNIMEYDRDDIQASKMQVDNVKDLEEKDKELKNGEIRSEDFDKSKVFGEFKGNEKITRHDSLNNLLGGGNYSKIVFAKTQNNNVMAYGENENGNLVPIPLVKIPGGPHNTNVIDRDGNVKENRTQSGFYINGMKNDEGLSININQFGKFELTYNRDITSKNPIGAEVVTSRVYNNHEMMKLVDKYNSMDKEIKEDNKLFESYKKDNIDIMKADLIAGDSDVYKKNDVFDIESSRELFYKVNGDEKKFNNIVKFAKEGMIDINGKTSNDIIKEYEEFDKRNEEKQKENEDFERLPRLGPIHE